MPVNEELRRKLIKGRSKAKIDKDGNHYHKCVHCPKQWLCQQIIVANDEKECSSNEDSVCSGCLDKYSGYTLQQLREALPGLTRSQR